MVQGFFFIGPTLRQVNEPVFGFSTRQSPHPGAVEGEMQPARGPTDGVGPACSSTNCGNLGAAVLGCLASCLFPSLPVADSPRRPYPHASFHPAFSPQSASALSCLRAFASAVPSARNSTRSTSPPQQPIWLGPSSNDPLTEVRLIDHLGTYRKTKKKHRQRTQTSP